MASRVVVYYKPQQRYAFPEQGTASTLIPIPTHHYHHCLLVRADVGQQDCKPPASMTAYTAKKKEKKPPTQLSTDRYSP